MTHKNFTAGMRPDMGEADDAHMCQILAEAPLDALLATSEAMTLAGFGPLVTYSPKVFIPLTRLCRDVCHYCTFATTPGELSSPFLDRDTVLAIARSGARAGCREALFTLGDQPEARYSVARAWLAREGYASTLDYVGAMAHAVHQETGLLPHLNPGLMGEQDYRTLRPVAVSMGIMLESTAERLCAPGGPHHGSPDKHPARRLESIAAAGRAGVALTTGLLIGIGETRAERIEAILAIRDLHRAHGHIQEVIVQNFLPKPDTRMAGQPPAPLEEHLWTIAAARLILGPEMSIQAPPNLQRVDQLGRLLAAGVNDWGGISPVTPDYVNPEAPWPQLERLAQVTAATRRMLKPRLAIGPRHARDPDRWLDTDMARVVRRAVDARGLPVDEAWRPGSNIAMPAVARRGGGIDVPRVQAIVDRAARGDALDRPAIARLFEAEGEEAEIVLGAADRARRTVVGDNVTYIVNRNINYTNICLYKCGFCAFSKSSTKGLRGPAYRLDLDEIARRAVEAQARGASEVCLQGGIHPDYDGTTYLSILHAVKQAAPGLHVHAFSPLEIRHGATTLGLSLEAYLERLRDAGLASLPGTAAEILDDAVRARICPDKLVSREWLAVMRAAHKVGLRSTATIMFGHVDGYADWATHLLTVRELQEETGGFTEFVPLPFVHMEAPMWRRGEARSGPSAREALLMHAIARLTLLGLIDNIQASWVKLGRDGAAAALAGGANDLGGVLMDESITRAAGGAHGQSVDVDGMRGIAALAGRPIARRTTLYGRADPAGAVENQEQIYVNC